jgi:uncharacterized paraquat-inducible protein A
MMHGDDMMGMLPLNLILIVIGVAFFFIILFILLYKLNRRKKTTEVLKKNKSMKAHPLKKPIENKQELTKFCHECGVKLDEKEKQFCSACGAKL